MIDRTDYVCHRMKAAQATNQSTRGWNFDSAVDDAPIWIRALAEICRPRSLVILAVMAVTVAVWWL
jgi:hypothetical protein